MVLYTTTLTKGTIMAKVYKMVRVSEATYLALTSHRDKMRNRIEGLTRVKISNLTDDYSLDSVINDLLDGPKKHAERAKKSAQGKKVRKRRELCWWCGALFDGGKDRCPKCGACSDQVPMGMAEGGRK